MGSLDRLRKLKVPEWLLDTALLFIVLQAVLMACWTVQSLPVV